VFLHAPPSLVETVLDGVADTGKTYQVGRVKAEEIGIFGGFNYK
jgi:hypothetical protein